MIKFLSKLILKLIGWKVDGNFPEGKKYVVVAAPHTSTWDFIIGRLYYSSIGRSVKFMIKGSYFFFPLGVLLRVLGAIPVHKNLKVKLTDQVIEEFKKRDELLLTIAPEGTRSLTKRWRKGFYSMAMGANVPIVLGYINFESKTVGAGEVFYPTGNWDSDIKVIMSFYKDKVARHPEKFYLS
ncbi:MAG: acyltransferase [Bacteroidetes bacterium]|nr:MAG: acyltransferase [Bacteroidota bacterium]